MAEKKAEKEKAERKATDRTVLAAFQIPRQVLRDSSLPEDVRKLISGDATEDPVTVYLEVGTGTGSKAKAVDAVVGEAEGTFRAPSTSSWKGGVDQGEETIPESKKFRRRRVD